MANTNIAHTATIAIIAFVLSACNSIGYTPYTFEQLRAADYTLPADVHKIVITTYAEPTINDESFSSTDTAYTNLRMNYAKQMPSIICSILLGKINQSGYLIAEADANFNTLGSIMAYSDSICSMHNADALLVIDKCKYDSFVQLYGQDDATLVSAMETDLRFISRNGISRSFETQHDTLTWYLTEDNNKFPDYRELYYSISEQIASHIAMQLLPSWETRRRVLIGTSSRQLSDASNWAVNDEWDRAKDIWANVAQNGSGIDKICATINLGLYYERLDNVLESAMWFSKALDLIDQNIDDKQVQNMKKQVTMLFQRSIDRQHEKVLLDKQMSN